MSRISDELRMFAGEAFSGWSVPYKTLCDLVDRIDAEMAELPRGKDGRPIHVGDTVYKAVNGDDGEYVIRSLRYSVPGWVVLIKRGGADASCIVRPDVLTHERPDSFERIADDIETFGNEADINDATIEFLCKIQERIYGLAKKEDQR
jgi:hypothetical protein